MTLNKLPRAPLLHHSVQEAIKAYIVASDLGPGDPLESEGELAQMLGVSRNSVREAVKGLESLGVLETRRGLGIFVSNFSFDPLLENLPYGMMRDLGRLRELLDIRRVLEEGMVEAAILTMTETDLKGLEAALAAMAARAGAGEPFSREDREFHRCLLSSLHNETLIKLLDVFWLAFSRASAHANILSPDPQATYLDHAAIVEAVVARDSDRAKVALANHYRGIRDRLDDVERGPDKGDFMT